MTASPLPPRSSRLTRLMLKELREILRDRRTIGTLILMPLILYPLLSIGFQQFLLSGFGKTKAPRYYIGFEDRDTAREISRRLYFYGGLPVDLETPDVDPELQGKDASP